MDKVVAKPDLEVKRVQVGCGPNNIFPDWWNVDIRQFKGIDQVMDVTEPWSWSGHLDYVYAEHFLEHLTFDQAIKFLSHAGKALKVGGKLRLTTPSLEWVLKSHFSFEDHGDEKTLQQTWGVNRAFHGWGHQFLYSKVMLKNLLEAMGFDEVTFFNYGESDDPELMDLERHGGWRIAAGYPTVWVVEAVKSSSNLKVDEKFVADANESYIKYVQSGH